MRKLEKQKREERISSLMSLATNLGRRSMTLYPVWISQVNSKMSATVENSEADMHWDV